jgi:hypothetical protein
LFGTHAPRDKENQPKMLERKHAGAEAISSPQLIFRMAFWRSPVTRYFFHILDGLELFADELGKSFSNSEEAISKARCLASELSKAGDFCRSNLVLVVDEHGQRIFECRAS